MQRVRISTEQVGILRAIASFSFGSDKEGIYRRHLGMAPKWERGRKWNHPPIRVPDSAKASVHRSLIRLLARGLIVKQDSCSHDGKNYTLTDAGKKMLADRMLSPPPTNQADGMT